MFMKNALLTVLTVGVLQLNSQAARFYGETFSYPDGALTTMSSPLWTAHSGAGAKPVQVNSGAITLQQNAGSGEDLNRTTGFTMGAGDTWYAGFDVTVTGGNTDVYFASFLEGTSNFQDRTFVTSALSGGDFTLGLGTGSTATAKWGTGLSFATTYRVVIAYSYDTKVNTLWVNPVLESDTSISLTSTYQSPITAFAIRQASPTSGSYQVIDNLAVGNSFADVVTIPEPSSLALGVLGIAGLALARRRKA
jgi:hypothetical protein